MKRTILAIDGIDGSGKSSLCARLAESLAGDVHVVTLSVDAFRHGPSVFAAHDGHEADIYYEHYYDFATMDAALHGFLGGARSIGVPVYDPVAERRVDTHDHTIDATALAIVEGVFARRLTAVRASHLVMLHVDRDEARRRIIERDTRKGRTRADIERRIDRRYFPSHDRYLNEERPYENATIVIDNTDVAHPRMRRGPHRDPDGLVWERLLALLDIP